MVMDMTSPQIFGKRVELLILILNDNYCTDNLTSSSLCHGRDGSAPQAGIRAILQLCLSAQELERSYAPTKSRVAE